MAIRKLTPLSHNIQNFIWKNNLSRRQFADLLNKEIEKYGDDVKIYTEKDIFGYETRASKPNDDRVLVAMAQIMSKPLEELLIKFFDMNSLALPKNKALSSNPTKRWSMATFNKLSEEDKNFILDIIATGLGEDHEKFYTVLDIELNYHEGKFVTATLYYGSDYEKDRTLEWTWNDYGKEMKELGGEFGDEDEAYIINRKLETDIFMSLWAIGLIDDIYCFQADEEKSIFEISDNAHGHFIANVWFSIPQTEMIKLLKLNVKRARNGYEHLLELESAKKQS